VDRVLEKRGEVLDKELTDIRADLRADVAGLKKERTALQEAAGYSDEIVKLKKEKADLTIERDVEKEKRDREVREVEHRVGLLRMQQEHEVAAAKKETELEIREGNLKRERDLFEKEMKFQREQFSSEMQRIEGFLGQVLKRLPNVDLAMTAAFANGAKPEED
jgi:hypothetical protein